VGGACIAHERDDNCVQNLVGKPEGKRTLGRPKHRSEDTIKVDLKVIGWEGVDWTKLSPDEYRW
jgi:hypothetical protein